MNRILVYLLAIVIFLFGARIIFQDGGNGADALKCIGILGITTNFIFYQFYATGDPLRLARMAKSKLPLLFWGSSIFFFLIEVWSLLITYNIVESSKSLRISLLLVSIFAVAGILISINRMIKIQKKLIEEN